MDSLDGSGAQNKEAQISAALERLWVRFLPEIRARVEILVGADLAMAAGTLSDTHRQSAASAAHKLAGTLGTFNLARGTVGARELEQLYGSGEGPSPQTAAQMANELRELVEGRATPAS